MRFRSLDTLRGIFALMIVLLHLPVLNSIYGSALVRNASIFVSFFFVLSGFVISFRYMKEVDSLSAATTFVASRIVRLWPLQFVVLVAFASIEVVKFIIISFGLFSATAGLTRAEMIVAVQQLFLLQAFNNEPSYLWNFPSWSISAELVAYSLFALACAMPRRAGICFALACTGLAFAVRLDLIDPGFGASFGHGLFSAIAGFFVGVMACILHNSRLWERLPRANVPLVSFLEGASVLGIVTWTLHRSAFPVQALLEPMLFAATILIFCSGRGVISSLFLTPPMQFLGVLSYAIYMTHILVLSLSGLFFRITEKIVGFPVKVESGIPGVSALFLDFGAVWINDLVTVGLIPVVLWVAHLANVYVERPSIDRARRIVS